MSSLQLEKKNMHLKLFVFHAKNTLTDNIVLFVKDIKPFYSGSGKFVFFTCRDFAYWINGFIVSGEKECVFLFRRGYGVFCQDTGFLFSGKQLFLLFEGRPGVERTRQFSFRDYDF